MKFRQEYIEISISNGQPGRFTWRGRTYRIREVLDRWVVDTQWWGKKVSRVYFRVRSNGGVFEIYREGEDWMLSHGMD